MARKPGSSPSAIKSRAAKTAAALAPAGQAQAAATAPAAPKKRTPPLQFFREVRAEARKITWTSRKETWITSVMVFIMVVLASGFFFTVDWLLGLGANLLLTFARG